jgi:uncharacterized protein YceK
VHLLSAKMITISLLCGILLSGCAAVQEKTAPLYLGQEPTHYVTFGSSVLCRSTDRACLRQLFDRCLGETKKKHFFESGPPERTALLPSGEAIAEWVFGGSNGRVVITYDRGGIARRWQYQATWGVLYSESASASTGDPELLASLVKIVDGIYVPRWVQ